MSDTLIFAPSLQRAPQPPTQPAHPAGTRSFADVMRRLSEAPSPAHAVTVVSPTDGSLLGIINALLAQESVSRTDLLALRGHVQRCVSQVNLISNLLRHAHK